MNKQLTVRNELDILTIGDILVKSGFFADTTQQAQAIVKVLAGAEIGFGPIASMTGIYIVKGKPSLSANLIAAAVKRSGKYNYRITEHTETACTIIFFEHAEKCGESRFTMEDAKRAGLAQQNWQKYPRNMLFARAMSNGAKWFCPDIFGGPVYTPDELGEVVDGETGEVIEGQFASASVPSSPPPKPPPTRAELEERWEDLWQQALSLDLNPDELPTISPDGTDAELIAAGKKLAAIVGAAKPEKKTWDAEVVAAVLQAELSKNSRSVAGALKKSDLSPDTPADVVVAWFRQYRASRDAEGSSDEAATVANAWLASEVGD